MKDASPSFNGIEGICNPLVTTSQTRLTHPQSADETLRQGYQLYAPGNINSAIKNRRTLDILLGLPTLGVLPALYQCCIPEPGVKFELTELHSESAVEGARWTTAKYNQGRESQMATRSSSRRARPCRSARTCWPSLSTDSPSVLLRLSFPRAHERMLVLHSAGSWVART